MDCQELDDVPSTFIVETRKENVEKYILRVHFTSFAPDCIATLLYFFQTRTCLSFVLASSPFVIFIGRLTTCSRNFVLKELNLAAKTMS